MTVFSNFKKFSEKCVVFIFLKISFMSGLIEDSWILISTFAFNLFKYHIAYNNLWKIPPYTCEKMRVEEAIVLLCPIIALL